jgi:lipoate-protein ligase B
MSAWIDTNGGRASADERRPLEVLELGRVPYREAWDLQHRLFERRAAGEIPDTLLLLEHPPTITLGRVGKREHLLASGEELAKRGLEVLEIDRGGDITYHGPGQSVTYPILDLTTLLPDLNRYVRALEETMMRVLLDYGLESERVAGMSGVWVRGAKVGAVGIRVKDWITMHGFALNVNTDLSGFGLIVPCGLHGRPITSLAQLLGRPVDLAEVRVRTVSALTAVFGFEPRSGNSVPGRG